MTSDVAGDVLDALQNAAERAYPREACGILLGKSERITQFVETANVHPSPQTHFEIDPQALIDAYRAERSGGEQVIGFFHSHPKGPAKPSATDQAMSSGDGKIWAIWGQKNGGNQGAGELRFWRDAPAGFQPLSYLTSAE